MGGKIAVMCFVAFIITVLVYTIMSRPDCPAGEFALHSRSPFSYGWHCVKGS